MRPPHDYHVMDVIPATSVLRGRPRCGGYALMSKLCRTALFGGMIGLLPADHSDASYWGSLSAAGNATKSAGTERSEATAGDGRGSLPDPALMTEIASWLAANLELPPTLELPRVEFVSPSRLVAIRLGGFAINQQQTASEPSPPQPPFKIAAELAAVYSRATRTIYLPDDWSGDSHAEMSVLVHEMVHHLQNVGGLEYPCPDAREKPAYLAQDRWLRRFGLDLETAFGLDLFTVFARSACFH